LKDLCWDYQRPWAHGVGIVNGGGLMLSLADARPDLRWFILIESLQKPHLVMKSFLQAVTRLEVPVAVWLLCGMLSSASAWQETLAALDGFDYYSNCQMPGRFMPLSRLLREAE